ncbi:monovalent cation/H(+) antiporter subunit G [Paenibacillus sp. HN-1]|uniref:monovalent cation/H(+) antiporter subunit G n=1 Tax=Paenibacillus TaxID=44249 RepID=UPI001CA98B1C|nr:MULTISPECIES: monovalent cation/H(+) antiporter subunit G [Paenibacillus]MBY9079761.1 monovalent cation/H(+) antiporter subunit G [Paenibacillus sp. CGMCC 1.18879]MBY9084405.1 monovalent cation/H(+) antiporter subunit G [Paenibacillus sinensis]
MKNLAELLAAVMVLIGAVICGISAFGLVRLPDVYLRSHAATMSATLGVAGVLTGVFILDWISSGTASFKLLLVIVFVFITSPVAGHLNGRAAYRSGVPLWKNSMHDELKPVLAQTEQEKTASGVKDSR